MSRRGLVESVFVSAISGFLMVSFIGCGGNGGTTAVGTAWRTAERIESNIVGDADFPQMAMGDNGHAVAVWPEYDGTMRNIWSNHYTPESGWGGAVLIETDNAGDALDAHVAMDGGGNDVAVWGQFDGTRNNIWANRFVAGSGWGTAVLIETDDTGDAEFPRVAMDNTGNAAVVWAQSDGTRRNIWANRHVPGAGWGTATLIETDNSGDADSPKVASRNDTFTVVWQQSDGTRTNIWANRYAPGSGWDTAILIETDDSGDAGGATVAVDNVGNAVAVWQLFDGTRSNVWANRYAAGIGWGTAALIETDDAGDAGSPQVGADGSGNAVAVWQQSDGTRSNIWANRYVAGTGWGTAALIETDDTGEAGNARVAVNGTGTAVAVWSHLNGTRRNIMASRFTPGSGWGTATLIETDDVGDADLPRVGVDDNGNAVAVWYQSDGILNHVWANTFR